MRTAGAGSSGDGERVGRGGGRGPWQGRAWVTAAVLPRSDPAAADLPRTDLAATTLPHPDLVAVTLPARINRWLPFLTPIWCQPLPHGSIGGDNDRVGMGGGRCRWQRLEDENDTVVTRGRWWQSQREDGGDGSDGVVFYLQNFYFFFMIFLFVCRQLKCSHAKIA